MSKTLPVILSAAAAAAGAAGAVVWCDTHSYKVSRYTTASDRILKDTRLVVLADLHDNVYGRHNKRLLDAIDKEKPDIVVSVGDLITSYHDPRRVRGEESIALMMTLSRRYPTVVVNGNHETRLDESREKYGSAYDDYEAMVHSAGGIILRNERVMFPERGIIILGLELPLTYYRHLYRKPLGMKQLDNMLGECDSSFYNVLAAHHPDYFPEYRGWGADMVLSGHIHGGIVRLPFIGGVISPTWRLFPKYDGGRFVEEGSTLVLSRGLGTHTIPLRFLNPGELITVDLKRNGGN